MLRAHDIVSAAVVFSENHRDFWHCCLAIRVKKLGAMFDYSAMLLFYARKEAWNIYEGYYRNVEAVAEANEAACLHTAVNIQCSSIVCRLVRNHAYGFAVQACKAYHDVLRPKRLNLKKLAVVHDSEYDFLHIIRLVRIIWKQMSHSWISTVRIIRRLYRWRVFKIVRGQIAQQLLYELYAVLFIFCDEVADAACLVVDHVS